MNTAFIPGVFDAALHMEDSITKAANYSGAALDLGVGFAPQGMGTLIAVVATISAMDETSGDETYTLTPQESADDMTFTDCGAAVALTAAGAAPLRAYAIPAFVSYRYIRLKLVVAGTTPSITYITDAIAFGVGA